MKANTAESYEVYQDVEVYQNTEAIAKVGVAYGAEVGVAYGAEPETEEYGAEPETEEYGAEPEVEIGAEPEQEVKKDNSAEHVLKLIKQKKRNNHEKKRIITFTLIFFVIALVVMIRYASLTQIGYQISESEAKYNELVNQIEKKEILLEQQMNLQEIEKIAKEKLGMAKPLPYQIKYIQIETVDRTELNNIEFTTEQDTRTWYQKLGDSIKTFFGFI